MPRCGRVYGCLSVADTNGEGPGAPLDRNVDVDAVTALGVAYVTYAEANPGMVKMMFAGDHKTEELEAAGACCYAVVLGQMAARLGKTELDAAVYQAGFPLWTFEHGLAFLRIDDKAEFARIETPLTDLVGMATRRLLSDPT